MIDIFKRDPRGRFIWRGRALQEWLPRLMDVAYPSHAVGIALECVAVFCERKAAAELERCAGVLRGHYQYGRKPSAYMASADEWLRKAQIIRKANEDAKEIPF